MCRPCKNKPNDYLDNIWHQFHFADNFFEDREHVPSDEQTDVDFDTSNSIDNWKVFNKRGLHLIYLNINSLLSKIDELHSIAKKSRATVIGITESNLMKLYLIEKYIYTLLQNKRGRWFRVPPTVHLRTNDVTWTYYTSC